MLTWVKVRLRQDVTSAGSLATLLGNAEIRNVKKGKCRKIEGQVSVRVATQPGPEEEEKKTPQLKQ